MANPDRLSGLDASFLSLENAGAHMHVGSVLVFDGQAPPYDEFVAMIESRLHQVPRYRQKLAFPPLAQARPVWVDDPHFNAGYHVRHTALPAPAGEAELRRLAGRVFSQRLDRSKPLWEIWLVDRIDDDRFALVCKTHHALVDGISGVDIMTVLFDLEPDPPEREPGPSWYPRPEPSGAALLADALAERAAAPLDAARAAAGAFADPGRAGEQVGRMVAGLASMAGAGLGGAPPSPLNVRIGPHRRFAWVEADLGRLKAVKNALGGTVNDVVLAVVAGALRAHLVRRGRDPEGIELKAMVPVSVRAEDQRGTLGNRVAAVYAPLPVGLADPLARFRTVHEALADLKGSAQALGAETLTQMAGFAAPTLLDQGARLQALQRLFNVTVTNVPGPQFPLYILGRRLRAFYPEVPLVLNTALGIAIMSYDGMVYFGLLGDYEAMADIDDLATDLQSAIDELSAAAGVPAPGTKRRGRGRPAARRRTTKSPAGGGSWSRSWPRRWPCSASCSCSARATTPRSRLPRGRESCAPTAEPHTTGRRGPTETNRPPAARTGPSSSPATGGR
jgi:diacylglycerol O-acyltransferase